MTMQVQSVDVPAADLRRFSVDSQRGFLPPLDPLRRLPSAFGAWEAIAQDLPKLLVTDHLRPTFDRLAPLDTTPLRSAPELERAMMLLSYFAHAYVWGAAPTATRLPRGISIPLYSLSTRLGRPPVLSYASYALHNWRRIDPAGPIALGNIAILQNFLAGQDEEWFILVHVDIEAHAAPAMAAIPQAQRAVLRDDPSTAQRQLSVIADSLERMYATLCRMPERCDPYVYFHRVRPYIHGWKNQPALPDGLIYEGVDAYAGAPQKFRGETGAQSSIIPSLDAALGVTHRDDPLKAYLLEMRDYMPPAHRNFVDAISAGPSVCDFVANRAAAHPSLARAYDACVHHIEQFRSRHLEYAASYIHRQGQRDPSNPSAVGTGGTPFMPYLKKHRDETAEHRIAGQGA